MALSAYCAIGYHALDMYCMKSTYL